MFFASDNWAGAHPAISQRLLTEAGGFAAPYGTSATDKNIETRFSEIFEREVAVFFVATGTAANSLSLASVQRPGGVTFCHEEAHIIADECGAPEFLTSASRLVPVKGENGKVDPHDLVTKLDRYQSGGVHQGYAGAISITQATEFGGVYTLDEISTISAIAQERNLPLHMDGARIANALVSLDCSLADMTWRRGIDIVSFGGTKNGCWCAEAIVFMKPEMGREMPYIRKRSAQLFSKTRFIAAQFEAYLKDDLWLDLARHANSMSDMLRAGLAASNTSRLAWETRSNEVFAVLPLHAAEAARNAGAEFYDWPTPFAMTDKPGKEETLIRLVTSFANTQEDVNRFIDIVARG